MNRHMKAFLLPFLSLLTALCLLSCAQSAAPEGESTENAQPTAEASENEQPTAETPVSAVSSETPQETAKKEPIQYAKGVSADFTEASNPDPEKLDPEKGVVYFGVSKMDRADKTNEPSWCYRFEQIFSAVDGKTDGFDGERITLAFQDNEYTDSTQEVHPVDSEEHFGYLKQVISALDHSGADTGSVCAFTLTLEKSGEDKTVYTFRCDKTVEIAHGNEKKYSSVDEETFAHLAMLCTLYTPYDDYPGLMLFRRDLATAENYRLEAVSGGKTKTFDADAAASFVKERFSLGNNVMTFAPAVNVVCDFENGEYVVFRETYVLMGVEYDHTFYLGADGRVYTSPQYRIRQAMINLDGGTTYLWFTGSALRVDRSKDSFDYRAVKSLIEN